MMQKTEEVCLPGRRDYPYADGKAGGAAFGGYKPTGIHNRIGEQIMEVHFVKRLAVCPVWDGGCSDAYQGEPEGRRYSGKKRLVAKERNRKHQRHLRKLASISERMQGKNTMYGGAVLVDRETGTMGKGPFYRRYWRGTHNNRFRYWRRVSNRKVRRYRGDVHNGGAYRKIFDYWWTVD